MPAILNVFLLAMTPLGELRAALPIALAIYQMPLWFAYLVAVLGNLVPVVFLLLFLEPVQKFLSAKSRLLKKFFAWIFQRTRSRGAAKITKYGWLGLIFFVAIPLPITGAWTGSALAFLYKIPFKKAFSAIGAGVLIAGAIVAFLTKTGITISTYLGWQALLIAVAVLIIIVFILKFKIQLKIRI